MDKNEAIELAIAALYQEADETYEQSEIDNEIEAWQQKRYDAVEALEKLRD